MSYRPVVRACAAAAFTVLIGVAAAAPASAEESAVASAEVLSAMQRDFGLTAAQAEQQLLVEAAAAQQQEQLTAQLGDRITGSWLDGSGRLVVRTADADAAAAVTAAGAVAAQGQDPDTVMNRLNSAAAADPAGRSGTASVPASVTSWYVDEAAGQVVVEGTVPAEAQAFATAAAGDQAGLVRVQKVTQKPRLFANIVGGSAIYSASGGRCSVGFSARSGSTTFVITAGHCTELGGSWQGSNRTALGSVSGTSFPGNDYGTIRVTNTAGWTGSSQVAGTQSVLGATVAAVGASTCRSGSTTGYRCGTIQSRNQTVNYGGGDIVSGLTRTSACAEPGDSGGSFVAGRQAQGMTSGGSGNCRTGGTTFYQPVQEALSAYGLTLVTG